MPDETKVTEVVETVETNDALETALQEIKRLKEETIPKEKYDALNNQMSKFIKGALEEKPVERKVERDANDIAKEQVELIRQLNKMDNNTLNLDYVKTVKQYRDNFIEMTGRDPFVNYKSDRPNEAAASGKRVGQLFDALAAAKDEYEFNRIFDSNVSQGQSGNIRR